MNLLPDSRKRLLSRMYLLRLGVVFTLLVAGVVVVHAVLTVPLLAHYSQEKQTIEGELVGVGKQLAGANAQDIGARIHTVSDRATYLTTITQQASATAALRALGTVAHAGVRITGVSFTRGTTEAQNKLVVVGVAASREDLRAYAAALQAQPFVASVDLPISAYAKETDIDFTLSVVGRLSP